MGVDPVTIAEHYRRTVLFHLENPGQPPTREEMEVERIRLERRALRRHLQLNARS